MYKENRSFHTPEDSTIIWRYIDFEKFVDLILTGQLFFCRSDKFDDPFEGIFKLKNFEETKEMFKNQQKTKKYYFLNCWHINEAQSDAMWKIFLKTNNGIAIKSSIGGLIKSLKSEKEDVHISRIYYRDYEKITYEELHDEEQNQLFDGRGSSVNQFNYKRIGFEHEKELRLYYIDLPIPHISKEASQRELLSHKRINVNLNDLIEEIVVAPFADEWFRGLVEKITLKFNLDFKITQSELYRFS